MQHTLWPVLVLAVALCVPAEKPSGGRVQKTITKLNTFVVGQNSAGVAPVLKTTRLTGSSETPRLFGSETDDPVQPDSQLSTKTIYGFLDFITTVGNTVMVFTPGAETAVGAESPKTVRPGSIEPSPSRAVPPIATTASEPLPERHLRFTSTEPASSVEPQTAEPPAVGRRKGKNLLWAKLRGRTPKGRRPFVLPQRRGVQTARPAESRPTPPLRRQFLSAVPPSVVPDTTQPRDPSTHAVTQTTLTTLKTIRAGDEFTTEASALPTEAGVTRVSSVIQGTVTEFPNLPAPAAEPEVLPIERLLESGRRPAVQSLQERLRARLQAALKSRPSAAAQRRPFTLVPEQRARSARLVRPQLPLEARRPPTAAASSSRRLSAADRLKQRLLKQRQQSAPADRQQQAAEPAEHQQQQQEILAVHTYRPPDASGFHYELTTLRSLHVNTLGRLTNSHWLTHTETRTVALQPTAARPGPAVSSTAVPAAATPGTPGGPTPSAGKVVMLPAVQLDPSSPSLPLSTMTETYSTTQLLLKSSVIPLVIGDSTQAFTLTQSYQVTRLVTALKTMPPMEVFSTAAPPGLVHRERPLLALGSENQVDDLGVPVVRVPPPEDLAAIGLFDVDHHESQANPAEYQLQHQAAVSPTPALPPQLGLLGGLPQLTPQQLAYLHLLGPLLPALQQPAVARRPAAARSVVTSSPVVYSTVATSVHSRAVVVTFRATPSTAFITSTSVFPTVVTSYVTTTMQLQPVPPLG